MALQHRRASVAWLHLNDNVVGGHAWGMAGKGGGQDTSEDTVCVSDWHYPHFLLGYQKYLPKHP